MTTKATKAAAKRPAKAAKASPKTPAKPASAKAGKKAATAPATQPGATRANTAATTPTPATAPARRVKPTRLSALQAAVKVLADAPPEGLSTKNMVKAMAERKLWTSPGGKTPEASLYASITREIAKKGEEARFRKVSRGRFALR